MTPGIATGVTDEPLKHPALPKEAPWPGSSASTRKTLWPSRCSQLAAHTPTMPAPITPTRLSRSATYEADYGAARQGIFLRHAGSQIGLAGKCERIIIVCFGGLGTNRVGYAWSLSPIWRRTCAASCDTGGFLHSSEICE